MRVVAAAKPIHDRLVSGGDNVFSRNAFNMLVGNDGYELVTLCRTRDVDLVLLPFTFGAFTGAAVCKSLRSLPAPPLTLMFVDTPEQAKQSTANETLIGSVEPREVVSKLARMLGVQIREDLRVLVRLRVEASAVAQTHLLLGTIIDISASGMLVETESMAAAGDVLSAEFYLPGHAQQIMLLAKVARVDDRDAKVRRLGMQFMRAQDDMTARIRAFVQSRAK